MIAGVCRVCGCTEFLPCILDAQRKLIDVVEADTFTLPDGATVCSWIEPDLCSGCVEASAPPLLYDAQGNPLRGAP